MSTITQIAIEALKPNAYNPNEMTEDEFAELVAEVRHLGRMPKPIVVRPNGAGYVIVDGEHGWRAAKEAGLEVVPCEVVDVDDFEAMRQTYKRNQHGTHNPVRLGQMFETMMQGRGLSQRALAKDVEVSEGTIRNALEFAKAAAARNDYAWSTLSVRQVRWYNRLPRAVADAWLKAGADCALIGFERGDPEHLDDPNCPNGSKWLIEQGIKGFQKLADAGLLELVNWGYGADGFKKALKTAREWAAWEGRFCYAGLTRKAVRPYTRHRFRELWFMRDNAMAEAALRMIFDAETKPPSFVLSPEEFEAVIKEAGEGGAESHYGFLTRLELAVVEKTGKRPTRNNAMVQDQLAAIELAEAPEWVRVSPLPPRDRLRVWRSIGPDWKKRELLSSRLLPDSFSLHIERAIESDCMAVRLDAKPKEGVAAEVADLIGGRLVDAKLPYNDLIKKVLITNLCALHKEELIALVDSYGWRDSLSSVTRIRRGEGDVMLVCGACGAKNRIQAGRLADGAKCGKCKKSLEPAGEAAQDAFHNAVRELAEIVRE